ncbi:MAG TPA: hypothetical protein VLC46_26745 [Thermoanaerobaculia bacterium]|jgi:hypothetical protein|nr:hypothetical protein [Thermoanaerobaculia bacterium]
MNINHIGKNTDKEMEFIFDEICWDYRESPLETILAFIGFCALIGVIAALLFVR